MLVMHALMSAVVLTTEEIATLQSCRCSRKLSLWQNASWNNKTCCGASLQDCLPGWSFSMDVQIQDLRPAVGSGCCPDTSHAYATIPAQSGLGTHW